MEDKMDELLLFMNTGPKARKEVIDSVGGRIAEIDSLLREAKKSGLIKESGMTKVLPGSGKAVNTYVLTADGESRNRKRRR